MYCGERTAVKTTNDDAEAVSLRCRSWNCASCQPDRCRELVAYAASGSGRRFFTFTTKRLPGGDPDAAARALVRALSKAIRKVRAIKQTQRFEYIWWMEATQLGWPHIHMIARGSFVKQQMLSEHFEREINAPNVSVSEIKNDRQAAAYAAKYAGKGPAKFKGCKRYSASRAWAPNFSFRKANKQHSSGWTTGKFTLREWLIAYVEAGFTVVEERRGYARVRLDRHSVRPLL